MGSTVPLWVVLLVGLASPLASFGTAWITMYWSHKRETRRLGHEKEMQHTELEEQRQADLRDQRREAYRTLARITKTIDPTQPYELRDLAEAYSEIELLTESPEVLQAAAHLYDATFQARKLARLKWNAGTRPAEKDHFVQQSVLRSQEQRDVFLDAARVEIGLPPSPKPLQQARVGVRELLAQQNEDYEGAREQSPPSESSEDL